MEQTHPLRSADASVEELSAQKIRELKKDVVISLAASKLKYRIQYLRNVFDMYKFLVDVLKSLPTWEIAARAYFKQLRLAIEAVQEAKIYLTSLEDGTEPPVVEPLLVAATQVCDVLKEPGGKTSRTGEVLGLPRKDSKKRDGASIILSKDEDLDEIAFMVDNIRGRLENWTDQEKEMEVVMSEARSSWKMESMREIEVLGTGK